MDKQYIVDLLMRNDVAIARALVAINKRQTDAEQKKERTIEINGVGFNGPDACMGTSMAQFYMNRGYLTSKQLAYWKKPNKKGVWKICKYANQLLEISQGHRPYA